MKPHQLRMKLKSAFRLAGVALIVIAPMSIRTAPSNEAQAYSSGPTGWCTDHSGRNFRCGSGGGSSSSGGGGCAQSGHHQRASAAERRSQSSAMNNEGVELYEQRKYATAAGSFEFALSRNPANTVARNNLGDALNMLGVNASKRRDYASALVYYERALKAREKKLYRDNLAKAQRSLPNGGRKTCGLCSKALISDVGYAYAAGAFETAINQDPGNHTARKNLGNALNRLGVEASKRGDFASSLLYYERALENRDTKQIRNNITLAKRDLGIGKKTCALCTRAIISDIGFGLDSSAEFSNYASQAISNFYNCKRLIPGECKGTKGWDFRQQLLHCNKQVYSGGVSAYKACVRHIHSQFR
ncbi:MAG: tetratricopeptide repeat protein [Magnetovibrio sp.]|nr:tetratricopeptide repeat protein [Magnetovibrio sp.]